MFGYITINKAELKFREFDVYHSYYCGLCRELKKTCGRKGQLTLTYDMTFLELLLTGLYEPETRLELETCALHPLKKHEERANECTSYVADMNLFMAWYQCKDDWEDDKKLKKYAMYQLLNRHCQELTKKQSEKCRVIQTAMEELSRGEKENSQDIDKMAGCFGTVLGEVFVWKKDVWEKTLRRMGFYLGKFIYIMDAYEDIEEDREKGRFNPLMDLYEKPDFEEVCQRLLTMMMAECCREFEKLPIIENVEILRNILYSGIWSHYNLVRKKRQERKHE